MAGRTQPCHCLGPSGNLFIGTEDGPNRNLKRKCEDKGESCRSSQYKDVPPTIGVNKSEKLSHRLIADWWKNHRVARFYLENIGFMIRLSLALGSAGQAFIRYRIYFCNFIPP